MRHGQIQWRMALLVGALGLGACGDIGTGPVPEDDAVPAVQPRSVEGSVVIDPPPDEGCDPWLDINWCVPDPCQESMTFMTLSTSDCGGGTGGGGGTDTGDGEHISDSDFTELCNPDWDPGCVLRGSANWTPHELQLVTAAEQLAEQSGCSDVADMLYVQRVTGQMKFWTTATYRYGNLLYGHVDPGTGQIRIWTGATVGDVIHEGVHKTTGITSDSPQAFRDRVTQCGGILR